MHNLIRVGVLRGGPSNEYEVSLKSGASVLHALRNHLSDRFHPRDIYIDREGNWHTDGLTVKPERALSHLDVVFNALHGAYGEDGKIQHLLESHHIPFTGSGSLSSAIGMNKVLSKEIFKKHGFKTPRWKEILSKDVSSEGDSIVRELFHSWTLPVIVKSTSGGSSVGMSLVRDYADLPQAFAKASEYGPSILIEEYIPGREATCGVVEGFRGHELYALPVVEIVPHGEFFDYDGKYAGKSREIVPAGFSQAMKHQLEDVSRSIHRLLGLRHYSRSDFIIHQRRGTYVLETNTQPGLTGESLLPKALAAVGSPLHEFVGHIVTLAHGGKYRL
jgi:D-alanine-D-alanine ligase